jgi:hypothetical protein
LKVKRQPKFVMSGLLAAMASVGLLSGCATTGGEGAMAGQGSVSEPQKPCLAWPCGKAEEPKAAPAAALDCTKTPEDARCVPPKPVAAAPAPAPQPPATRVVAVTDAGAPPNRAGECYARVLLPAEFRADPMQQLVREASERRVFSEVVYEEVDERIQVKPASKRVEVVPAEFSEVTEQVLVREAYRREIDVPALYNTFYERVMVTPARDVWKPGRGEVERVDPLTGEIWCLVHEEATFKTVERKELFRPAGKRSEDVAAEYTTVKKMVQTKPETIREVEIPAEFQTIKVRRVAKMPEPTKVPVAAQFATVNKQVMVRPERAEWAEVLCDVNATPAKIQEVEKALSARGVPVKVDGRIDQDLTDGIRTFQKQNGLFGSGLITAETLSRLGVSLR